MENVLVAYETGGWEDGEQRTYTRLKPGAMDATPRG